MVVTEVPQLQERSCWWTYRLRHDDRANHAGAQEALLAGGDESTGHGICDGTCRVVEGGLRVEVGVAQDSLSVEGRREATLMLPVTGRGICIYGVSRPAKLDSLAFRSDWDC